MRSQLLIGALLFSACAAPLQITGPYAARLSDSDVEQIKQVVSARPHIDHRLRKIEVVRPDRVRVEAGHTDASGGWSGTGFFVIRQSGRWLIDERSGFTAEVERTIVVY